VLTKAGHQSPNAWAPTRISDVIRQYQSSTAPSRVRTDAGEAFVKTLGNPEGPSALVCEYVGTRLAAWLGLPTLDVAVVPFPAGLALQYPQGCHSLPGPAFATRAVEGREWGGTVEDLAFVANPDIIAGLVVFDTWTRNCDRYCVRQGEVRCNLKNVYLCEEDAPAGQYRLLALDQSACFRCGQDLHRRHFQISATQEMETFGLFPEFVPYVTRERVRPFLARLLEFQSKDMSAVLSKVPEEWALTNELRELLSDFCLQRATFVGQEAERWLAEACGWPTVLSGPDDGKVTA
jgi:hypothetical protein